LNTAPV
jgi:hypothetical protein